VQGGHGGRDEEDHLRIEAQHRAGDRDRDGGEPSADDESRRDGRPSEGHDGDADPCRHAQRIGAEERDRTRGGDQRARDDQAGPGNERAFARGGSFADDVHELGAGEECERDERRERIRRELPVRQREERRDEGAPEDERTPRGIGPRADGADDGERRPRQQHRGQPDGVVPARRRVTTLRRPPADVGRRERGHVARVEQHHGDPDQRRDDADHERAAHETELAQLWPRTAREDRERERAADEHERDGSLHEHPERGGDVRNERRRTRRGAVEPREAGEDAEGHARGQRHVDAAVAGERKPPRAGRAGERGRRRRRDAHP